MNTGAATKQARLDPRVYIADVGAQGLPKPEPEYRFHPERQFRFDFAWPRYHVALEVEGGIYRGGGKSCNECKQPIGGAHRAIKGILKDMEKQNEAVRFGWLVIRVPPDRLYHDKTYTLLRTALNNRGWMPSP